VDKLPLRYWLDVGKFSFDLREINGREEISKPFRLEAKFVIDDPAFEFDPDDVVKQEVVIRLEREGQIRRIQGVVTDVVLAAAVRGAPEVTIIVEPRFAILRYRRDYRLFRDKTAPEIVQEVVQALGVKIELRLRDSYERRPYCVQFRETDFDFVNRMLEDEGIFYYFLDNDTMVLGDSPAAYETITGDSRLPFRAGQGMNLNEDAVFGLGSRAALTPGKVTLRDWNTEHPSLNMDVSAPTKVPGPEWYDYPGEYLEPGAGNRKAKLMAEAEDCAAAAFRGGTTTGRFVPGAIFKLAEAPAGLEDGGYMITAVDHAWHRDKEGFKNHFEALGEEVTFRPARTTYVPRILNPITGFVTTPPGQDIHCDHFGRVKVHFHWDRLFPRDDTCSHWIPVLQDNTGHSCAIPRVNWEVMVHFLEGDPDRPVVLGRVYNDEDPFHEKLPAAKTRSGLKSMNSPGRMGTNEIRFDDLAGSEQIFVHAEKDQNINIANNKTENVLNNENTTVKNDESITIGNDATWDIGAHHTNAVKGNQKWDVTGERTRKVSLSDSATVDGNRTMTITGSHEREIYFDDATSAKEMQEEITASVTEKFKVGHLTEIGKTLTVTVTSSYMETAGDSKNEGTGVKRVEIIKGKSFTEAGAEMKMRVNKTRTTTVTGAVTVKATKMITLTGAEKFSTHSPSALFNGATDITLQVGKTIIMLKDKLVKITAPQTISLLVSSSNNQGAGMSTQI
jgi:type VI secretion system secreted protein VgrG